MRSYRLVLSFAIAALPLCAQDSLPKADTLPLHRGQWAMQIAGVISLAPPPPAVIGVSIGTPGVGLLRFTSPRHAWSFNLTLTGGHTNTTDKDTSSASCSHPRPASVRTAGQQGSLGISAARIFQRAF